MNALFKLWHWLYPSIPARFASSYSVDESVQRLHAVIKPSVLSCLLPPTQAVVGRVTERSVRLQRVIPFYGNSFKPCFMGTFEQHDGKVVLDGRFTMFTPIKIFMTFWLASATVGCLLLLAHAVFGVARMRAGAADALCESPASYQGFIPIAIAVALPAAGVGFIKFGWWLSKNDIAYISGSITSTLGATISEMPGGRDFRKVVISIASAVFLSAFIAFAIYDHRVNTPKAASAQNILEREFQAIKPLPGATVVSFYADHKTSQALTGSMYSTTATYAEIRQYYDGELARLGWKFQTEEPVRDWWRDLGGRTAHYRKNGYSANLQYAGEKADAGWVYTLDLSWGLEPLLGERRARVCKG
ncbi:hypothetical protein [Burkholderia sp. Ac-20353]|uniref:hypothetical protein n=1 Tax=Burkholderia sp. Ac-20353 TaxID=2703894 RepID=UPI00197B1543|nr:hypothetical protein [Burkholderia sp. Ac-20353]MBN3786750.1 hypothetical protein [Burkholderia sp. Ac-20353]